MFNADKLHIIGIGGIGISALAFWALKEGKQVTGSDVADSALIKDLRSQGAMIEIGHRAENYGNDVELVLYTEAIDFKTNPEYSRAKELDIRTMSYFQALAEICEGKKTILVTGTKGKTTTTAMLGLALIEAGLDPTVIVGSKVNEFGLRNIHVGNSDLVVVEACEYRRSFLNFEPFGVIILNCVPDHLDYYKDEDDYVGAFVELAKKVPKNGFIVYNKDDKNASLAAESSKTRLIGVNRAEADSLEIKLQVLGSFNQLNALHALKAAKALGRTRRK